MTSESASLPAVNGIGLGYDLPPGLTNNHKRKQELDAQEAAGVKRHKGPQCISPERQAENKALEQEILASKPVVPLLDYVATSDGFDAYTSGDAEDFLKPLVDHDRLIAPNGVESVHMDARSFFEADDDWYVKTRQLRNSLRLWWESFQPAVQELWPAALPTRKRPELEVGDSEAAAALPAQPKMEELLLGQVLPINCRIESMAGLTTNWVRPASISLTVDKHKDYQLVIELDHPLYLSSRGGRVTAVTYSVLDLGVGHKFYYRSRVRNFSHAEAGLYVHHWNVRERMVMSVYIDVFDQFLRRRIASQHAPDFRKDCLSLWLLVMAYL